MGYFPPSVTYFRGVLMVILAAGAADPSVGPGRLIGLVVGALVCYVYWRVDKWREAKKAAGDPSPTPPALPPSPRDSQARAVSSHVSPDETADEKSGGHWWGRITRDAKGNVVRAYGKARHIAATGDSPPDVEPVPDDVVDDDVTDFDLALDDDPADHEGAEVERSRESREEYIARCVAAGVDKPLIVKALIEHYGLSRAQAYRLMPPEGKSRPAA